MNGEYEFTKTYHVTYLLMWIPDNLFHRHTGLWWDGPKIKISDLDQGSDIARKSKENKFTQKNTFDNLTEFPPKDNPSISGNVTLDFRTSMIQSIELTWASAHTITLDYLVSWVPVVYVKQSWTWTLSFSAGTHCSPNATSLKKTWTYPYSLASGYHAFTILFVDGIINVFYSWNPV